MKIILMRHGQAEGFKFTDEKRKLTALGHKQAKESARYILDKYQPDMMVSSPYDRAVQTLEAFIELAPNVPIKVLDYITPADNASQSINRLGDEFADVQCLLVVCHMPIVANMAANLLGNWATSYSLAEARVIDTSVLVADLGTQIDSYIPKQYED